MHTASLPPSDRDERQLADPALVSALESTGLSNAEIARGIGYSTAVISTYKSGKYEGRIDKIEAVIREWLRDRTVAADSGVPTIDTKMSNLMCERFEEIRVSRELALMIGDAGWGKSRGLGRYLINHTLAIGFRTLPWRAGMNAIAEDLSKAAGIQRLAQGEKRWDAILDRTRDSGRLLVVDDAHELSQRALQCCVDYHDETGNPVCLLGLPMLKKRLLKDARRARRIDAVVELAVTAPIPLIEHLVNHIAPDANGERDALVQLCAQVAAGIGAFGSVEKQLKFAGRARKKKPSLTWLDAFRVAHLRLVRGYDLN